MEKVRLGGMALTNGVLVHGPTAWACAVRTSDGELRVSSARKSFRASEVRNPLLRGPARVLEALALLPEIRRAVPHARLPFERPAVLAAMLASAAGVRLVRGSDLRPAAQELASGLLALAPALLALRGSQLAAYHGAEHVSIGSYEHGGRADKEHERCGTHLVGPLLATSALGNIAASRAPEHLRAPARAAAAVGALAASTELFGWMVRNRDRALARVLARPGHELQARFATAEPTPEQVEVAEAALRACLELETSPDPGDVPPPA
ncbi:MAG: DUF1385 domain-containing protein [Thermoleophilia bacterium]|nr:DUF1385 domain-containing protein [Thermoleophilia bacterium]